MTLDNIIETVESWYFPKETEIYLAQREYKRSYGKHLQCPSLFDKEPPSDGQFITPKNVKASWELIDVNLSQAPCDVEIHEYKAPGGEGYLTYLEFKTLEGRRYRKIYNYGPDTSLEQAWEEVTD